MSDESRCTDDDLRAVAALNDSQTARAAAAELLAIRAERRRDSRRAEQVRKLRWAVENAIAKIEEAPEMLRRWQDEDKPNCRRHEQNHGGQMPQIAQTTLATLADHAVAISPPARGSSIARTLRQLADIAGGLPLDMADAAVAYRWLGEPHEDDDGPTRARRATCADLARIAREIDVSRGPQPRLAANVACPRMAAVLERIAAHFAPLGAVDNPDPRQRAIAETCSREADELRANANAI